ncbi:MAG: transposase [Bacteroidales bacterium]
MKYNPEIHHRPFDRAQGRRSIRLRGYDYSRAGAYFITLCAQNREHVFGEIVDGKMILNDAGRVVAESWQWLANQYDYVDLDEWVIMPNHMHGIVLLIDDENGGGGSGRGGSGRGSSRTAPTMPMAKRKPIGGLVGAFKTVSTKRINQMHGTPGVKIWQRNYYEHIIRNENELNRIRQYIINNPARWATDHENPNFSGWGGSRTAPTGTTVTGRNNFRPNENKPE